MQIKTGLSENLPKKHKIVIFSKADNSPLLKKKIGDQGQMMKNMASMDLPVLFSSSVGRLRPVVGYN